jgi:hypothetical protein
VAGTAPFFAISGGPNNFVKIKRVRVSGITLTAVGYLSLVLSKYSTAPTGGTPSVATKVPLLSNYPASDAAICQGYTAAPTAGTLVGEIGAKRVLGQATTAAAAGIPQELEFTFDDSNAPVLLSAAEVLALRFSAAPASAPTLSIEVEWEEFLK